MRLRNFTALIRCLSAQKLVYCCSIKEMLLSIEAEPLSETLRLAGASSTLEPLQGGDQHVTLKALTSTGDHHVGFFLAGAALAGSRL